MKDLWARRRSGAAIPAILVVVAIAATGCSGSAQELTVEDRIEQVEAELVGAGTSEEVAACVVRLARHDLRRGPLDDVTRSELVLTCDRAQAILDGDGGGTEPASAANAQGPNTLGDDPALDRLWLMCEQGSGAACDELFEQSPVGSEYELFAVSCGQRDEVLRCSELDENPDGNQSS